jgi:hypothetical protein
VNVKTLNDGVSDGGEQMRVSTLFGEPNSSSSKSSDTIPSGGDAQRIPAPAVARVASIFRRQSRFPRKCNAFKVFSRYWIAGEPLPTSEVFSLGKTVDGRYRALARVCVMTEPVCSSLNKRFRVLVMTNNNDWVNLTLLCAPGVASK